MKRLSIPRFDLLTQRERVVLERMTQGMSAKQIAEVECVCVATVRSHIQSILWKLGAATQLEAVVTVYNQLLTERERLERLGTLLAA